MRLSSTERELTPIIATVIPVCSECPGVRYPYVSYFPGARASPNGLAPTLNRSDDAKPIILGRVQKIILLCIRNRNSMVASKSEKCTSSGNSGQQTKHFIRATSSQKCRNTEMLVVPNLASWPKFGKARFQIRTLPKISGFERRTNQSCTIGPACWPVGRPEIALTNVVRACSH